MSIGLELLKFETVAVRKSTYPIPPAASFSGRHFFSSTKFERGYILPVLFERPRSTKNLTASRNPCKLSWASVMEQYGTKSSAMTTRPPRP